jgi:hypothetical protein
MNASPLAGLDLHDILAAPPPSFWPPAPGWWVLAAVLLAVLGFTGRRLFTAWRRRRRVRHILYELDALATRSPNQMVVIQVSTLLRRVALMRFARQEVAPLSGKDWLAFLDRTGGNGAFREGAGSVLATAPYVSSRDGDNHDNEDLIALARQWIKQNVGRRP